MSPFRLRGCSASNWGWGKPASMPSASTGGEGAPLEAEDAGIFFGRDAPIVEALDRLRGLRAGVSPRLLVILGASGAGKSSFLRAGLLPRLARDNREFMPFPIIRPERAAMFGETGLLSALERAFAAARIAVARAELRRLVQGGAAALAPLLRRLADEATPISSDDGRTAAPALIVCVDQAEELFLTEAQDEAQAFLALLRGLLIEDAPAIIAIFTIRSDNYERLQLAGQLEGLHQEMLNLPTMRKGSYAEVVKRPAQQLEGTARALEIDDALVDALLADIEADGDKDSLPLLAFTMERLYGEYHAGGHLRLAHYDELGRVKGSIEAALERALKAADADPTVPKDRFARLDLLRRGLIPWLAGIDPDTGAPRRRVARLSEIPAEARSLIQHLVEQRLLATDLDRATGEATIEPAHEALLRQLSLLQGWLAEDAGLLAVLEGVKRASRDWAANGRDAAWLAHATDRLAAAERLKARLDLAAHLEPTDRDYLAACRKAESAAKSRRRRLQAATYVLLVGVIAGLIGWINQAYLAAMALVGDRPSLRGRVCLAVRARAGGRTRAPAEGCLQGMFGQTGKGLLPADGRSAGRVFRHGIAGDRVRPSALGTAAASGHDRQKLRRVRVRVDVRRMGRLRRLRRLPARHHRQRMGPRPAAGDQRDLGRCRALRGMAIQDYGQTLSAAHGGRVRIRDARGVDDGLPVERRNRPEQRQLQGMRQPLGQQADGAGRLVRRQRLRPVRHGRQCLGMGRGLSERKLSGRAERRFGRDRRPRLQEPDCARRFLAEHPGPPALGRSPRPLARIPRQPARLSDRPDAECALNLVGIVVFRGLGGEMADVLFARSGSVGGGHTSDQHPGLVSGAGANRALSVDDYKFNR